MPCSERRRYEETFLNELPLISSSIPSYHVEFFDWSIESPFIPEMDEIRQRTGRYFKSEIYYDLSFTQARNQDRCTYVDGPEVIRSTIQTVKDDKGHDVNVIMADPSVYLSNVMYYGYDDATTEHYLHDLRM